MTQEDSRAEISTGPKNNVLVRGLVRFVPTVAYHFCLALPAAFTQPGSRLLSERSSICSVDASYGTFGGGETETEEAPRKCSRVSAGMAFESDERASALASCRRAVEENADSFTGMLGRYVWSPEDEFYAKFRMLLL